MAAIRRSRLGVPRSRRRRATGGSLTETARCSATRSSGRLIVAAAAERSADASVSSNASSTVRSSSPVISMIRPSNTWPCYVHLLDYITYCCSTVSPCACRRELPGAGGAARRRVRGHRAVGQSLGRPARRPMPMLSKKRVRRSRLHWTAAIARSGLNQRLSACWATRATCAPAWSAQDIAAVIGLLASDEAEGHRSPGRLTCTTHPTRLCGSISLRRKRGLSRLRSDRLCRAGFPS